MKTTPGPWRIFGTADGADLFDIGDPDFLVVGQDEDQGDKVVCGFYLGNYFFRTQEATEQTYADARLVTAAPDMQAALRGLGMLPNGYCFCFGQSRDANKPEQEHTGECQAARAALRKAEGDGGQTD